MRRGFTLVEILIATAIVGVLVTILVGAFGGCSVSNGDRMGTLTKFSYKGIVWKTWEGEMVMGGVVNGAANVWDFSVRRDNPKRDLIVTTLQNSFGKPVHVIYKQSFWVFPWEAATTYDVVEVK